MSFFDLDPKEKDATVHTMFGLDRQALERIKQSGQGTIVIAFSKQFPPKLIVAKNPRLDLVNAEKFAVFLAGEGWSGPTRISAGLVIT